MDNFTKRFIKGLEECGISYNEILNGEWSYAGGSRSGRRLDYYKDCFGNIEPPSPEDNRICGHSITENCYLKKDNRIIVLGNVCIKRFVPKEKAGRTCENCGEPHKNRKINRCNECRKCICEKCGEKCSTNYKTCYNCYK
jgi:hypothetical protein